jgi:hypothetical protein
MAGDYLMPGLRLSGLRCGYGAWIHVLVNAFIALRIANFKRPGLSNNGQPHLGSRGSAGQWICSLTFVLSPGRMVSGKTHPGT